MNNTDNKIMLRATLRLVLDNQLKTEKLKAAKSQSQRNKKAGEQYREMWLKEKERLAEEKEKSEKLQIMAAKLLSKTELRCTCEVPEECENRLCAHIGELSAEILRPIIEEPQGPQPRPNSSSSSSSSSDSD